MLVIDRFRGEHEFLSNFHRCEVNVYGIPYLTSEHAFQAQKAVDFHDRCLIADAPNPREAKRLGRSIRCRDDWQTHRKTAMLMVLLAKFNQHPDLAARLAATGAAMLVEGNDWHDNFWGVCSCTRCQARGLAGSNYLGKLLMCVREVVRVDPV